VYRKLCTGGSLREPIYFVDLEYWELQTISSTPPSDANIGLRKNWLKGIGTNREGGPAWFGGITSMENANELIKLGWREGAERALKLKEQVQKQVPEPLSVKRTIKWDDEGDELSIDRLYNGQIDEMWRRTGRKLRSGPRTVSILTNYGGNCMLTAEEMFWTGAASIALADILEDAGYVTEISGYNSTGHGRQGVLVQRVRVKEAGEPLRPDTLAALTAHAGIFRVFGILLIELCPWAVGSGHGNCLVGDEHVRKLIALNEIPPQEIILPPIYNERAAVEALKKALTDVQEKPLGWEDDG
jgi:hypothetical protein